MSTDLDISYDIIIKLYLNYTFYKIKIKFFFLNSDIIIKYFINIIQNIIFNNIFII